MATTKTAAKTAAKTNSQSVKFGKERRNAEFHQNLPDITPTDFKVLKQFEKTTGIWTIIQLGNHQLMVDSGELLAIHNDAVKGVKDAMRIFVGDHIEENAEGVFLPNLKIGVKGGKLLFAA